MGYSPTQIAASRAGVATGAGAAGAATYGALPTLDSFLPRRAEGDPAAAINRSNAPVDYGLSDAEYREENKPSLFEPASNPGLSDYDDLYKSLMAAPQREGPASTGSTRSVPASAPAASAPAAAADPSFMSRLFGGPDFQSNNQAVVSGLKGPMSDGAPQRTMLNFGDSNNAADFFRADKAMQELQRNKEDFVGMASGGAANGSNGKASNGRDAALHKALEIIHHMMVNRR